MWRIKPLVFLTDSEIKFLQSMPPASDEYKMSTKGCADVDWIYGKTIEQLEGGEQTSCWVLETKNKWPSGQKVTTSQAQRLVLKWLKELLQDHRTIQDIDAGDFFFRQLNTRPARLQLIRLIYEHVS